MKRKIILDTSDYSNLMSILIANKMQKEDMLCKLENLETVGEYYKKEVKIVEDLIEKIEMNNTLIFKEKKWQKKKWKTEQKKLLKIWN